MNITTPSDKNDTSKPKIISVKEAESAAYSICQSIWADEAERFAELIDYKYNQYQIDSLSIYELEQLDVCSLYTDIRRLMAYFEQETYKKVYSSLEVTCTTLSTDMSNMTLFEVVAHDFTEKQREYAAEHWDQLCNLPINEIKERVQS